MMVVMMFMMMMVMVMVMVVLRMMVVGVGPRFAPGAPEHPAGNQHNDNPRDQLKPGLRSLGVPAAAKPQAGHGDQPDHRGMRDRRRQPQQNRLL